MLVGASEFTFFEFGEGSEDHLALFVTVVASGVCVCHVGDEVVSVVLIDGSVSFAFIENTSNDLFELVDANSKAVLTSARSGWSSNSVRADLRHLHGCLTACAINFSLQDEGLLDAVDVLDNGSSDDLLDVFDDRLLGAFLN